MAYLLFSSFSFPPSFRSYNSILVRLSLSLYIYIYIYMKYGNIILSSFSLFSLYSVFFFRFLSIFLLFFFCLLFSSLFCLLPFSFFFSLFPPFLFIPRPYLSYPVGTNCRIHRLHLCRGVTPTPLNECPRYDCMVPEIMELWRMRSTPSLTLLPGPLWPCVVTPDRTIFMG